MGIWKSFVYLERAARCYSRNETNSELNHCTMSDKKTIKGIEARFSKCSQLRYPGDRKWKDDDVPTDDNNPKEQQDKSEENK